MFGVVRKAGGSIRSALAWLWALIHDLRAVIASGIAAFALRDAIADARLLGVASALAGASVRAYDLLRAFPRRSDLTRVLAEAARDVLDGPLAAGDLYLTFRGASPVTLRSLAAVSGKSADLAEAVPRMYAASLAGQLEGLHTQFAGTSARCVVELVAMRDLVNSTLVSLHRAETAAWRISRAQHESSAIDAKMLATQGLYAELGHALRSAAAAASRIERRSDREGAHRRQMEREAEAADHASARTAAREAVSRALNALKQRAAPLAEAPEERSSAAWQELSKEVRAWIEQFNVAITPHMTHMHPATIDQVRAVQRDVNQMLNGSIGMATVEAARVQPVQPQHFDYEESRANAVASLREGLRRLLLE